MKFVMVIFVLISGVPILLFNEFKGYWLYGVGYFLVVFFVIALFICGILKWKHLYGKLFIIISLGAWFILSLIGVSHYVVI